MSEGYGKDHAVRAAFADTLRPRIGGNTTKVFLRGLAEKSPDTDDGDAGDVLDGSPLLSSTPPTVSKTLVTLYPYLIVCDELLSVVTWTGSNIWTSVLAVLVYISVVLYLEQLTKYVGHVVIVSLLLLYSKLDKFIEGSVYSHASLEDIIAVMERVSFKFDLLLSPLNNLSMENVERLLLTMVLLSPVHLLITAFVVPPTMYLLLGGLFLLTYHSPWSKVTRRLLWKFKSVRLLVYYLTGLNLGGINRDVTSNLFNSVQKKINKTLLDDHAGSHSDPTGGGSGKSIKFTYVLFENQRHWIGIGWKSSMLSYERTPWTDEFLNEAPSPENFQLPSDEKNEGVFEWRWIDKTWRLDLTNDGAIPVDPTSAKTTANPGDDEGYVYYDNSWKKPSVEPTFSKYTRRRRWVRTAELVKIAPDETTSLPQSPEKITAGEADEVQDEEVETIGTGDTVGTVDTPDNFAIENLSEVHNRRGSS
ncbi:peroxisome biogenesis protein KNAG_0C05940 [Huiozyma naganishii CBS 8797]|uniref:Peroxin/Ferlin domain-containing protein n=1 Tax=Huiozyma naganishii (strain ATCC MYA-139 / BCRC 22969 / CBS 8797 / KCTC 17520 / NBRC 10181 / NCYC 3082 / Yp74L-3) TaxID=1071383 RepID=J7RX94_HUIN7|nr:hypothetical protein KNAG_0C05940 [Kazachstania naganishii CBS 8797]CCK69692.1 hypothetical protein KNAG_0C05940 [Kazachstania naganishii CBS 8797]